MSFLSWLGFSRAVEEGVKALEPTAPKKPQEKTEITYYSVGITDHNRVSLKIGYSEVTMNTQGVQDLIDQLALFKQQIMNVEPTKEGKDHA